MALTTNQIIEECNDLIRFDRDAIGAYDEAINGVNEPRLREQLLLFRGDHMRHVDDLSSAVRNLGGNPVEKPGLRGAVRKTMTKVAGLTGTEAVLRAMESNEQVLNKQYAMRANADFPQDILQLIRDNYADEQRHLAWVQQALRERLWEQAPLQP